MNIAPKKRKWVKWLFALSLALVVLVIALHYIIAYRFKEVLQYVVSKESNNKYSFNASKVNISFLEKKIVASNVELICKDTTKTSRHYDAAIKQLYLSIDSWKELLFKQKLTVDSLAVIQPSLTSHDHGTQKSKHSDFHFSEITKSLEKTMSHLSVRSFSIQNGAFTLSHAQRPTPLESDRINLFVRNFAKKKDKKHHFLSSDDVDLSITNQVWNLPDGLHEITFKNLHFSGKSQFFEIDSCSFRSTSINPNKINFSADKVFFNSKDLTAIYDREELMIDSLLIIKPVVLIEKKDRENKKTDTASAIQQTVKNVLAGLNFKYIDIMDGKFIMTSPNNPHPTYSTNLTSLKIYNLTVQKETNRISTDSIELDQKEMTFITKDSLFQMTIGEFLFRNNDLILKNAVYKPTPLNHANRGLTFHTPVLRLSNISIEDLLLKRLKGSHAELTSPVITLVSDPKSKRQLKTPGVDKADLFYKTLHGLREMISVDSFRVNNGSMTMKTISGPPLHMSMKQLNTLILLNKFFSSDSLIDIKRSLPDLRIKEIAVRSSKLTLDLHNYDFNGTVRHNYAEWVKLSLANHTRIEGKKISWEILDWDLLEKYTIIQIDHLRIQSLNIASSKNTDPKQKAQEHKDLPIIRVGRIDIDHMDFANSSPDKKMHFEAQNLCIDEINSVKNYLTWNNLQGTVRNIAFDDKNLHVSAEQLDINNHHESILHNTTVHTSNSRSNTKLRLPRIIIRSRLNSTDFSSLHIQTLAVDNATLNYLSGAQKDSIDLSSTLNIRVNDLRTFKEHDSRITYNKADITLKDIILRRGSLNGNIPELMINLSNGKAGKDIQKKLLFQTAVKAEWSGANASLSKPGGANIILDNLSGNFNDPDFILSKQKFDLNSVLSRTGIGIARVQYSNKKITAKAGSVEWNNQASILKLRHFSVMPNKTMEEVYADAQYQTDYLTVQGGGIDIIGARRDLGSGDSTLRIQKVILDKILLNTTKDKRMPLKHGKDKPMLAGLIGMIKFPFHADTIQLQNSKVIVNEISATTKKKGTIPLEDINAQILNAGNSVSSKDSIYLFAKLRLFNNHVRELQYAESYHDSLSSFRFQVKTSPMFLTEYTAITRPLASASINKGTSDTMYASWTGNKYAAVGKMNFYYDDLKVQLLNKKDSSKKGLILTIENMLANSLVIKDRNTRSSTVFFVRDPQRSVFSYWIKTKLSGVMSSVVKMKNRSNIKKYKKLKHKYKLQDIDKK